MKEFKTEKQIENFYLMLIPGIVEVARKHGYAVGIHGSLTRDLDLIAMPWTGNCSDRDTLANAIAKQTTATPASRWELKPHGRYAQTMMLMQYSGIKGHPLIDLSVGPRFLPDIGTPQ